MMINKLIRTAIIATAFCGVATTVSAKTLVYCSEASPEGFDPALYTSGTTFDASSRPVFNKLVDFVKGTSNIKSGLAERWDISDDGLTYTFHLTKGVKFHTTSYFTPSRDFNADDVIFSFERQWKKDNPWHNYTPGVSWQYFESMEMNTLFKSIDKIDDYTVRFTLNRPEAPFLANMAMPFAVIYSKEYGDKLEKEGKMELMNQQPVGTGPFIFVGYQKDAVIRFKANPDYFQGKQPIDNLVFAITLDPSVRMQKLKANECQIASYPNPNDLPDLKADKNLIVQEQAGLNIAYLAYNTEEAPFNKIEVRQALNKAVNKQAIVDAVFGGAGQVAQNPIPPTMWGFNKNIRPDEYNPEEAKKMLDKAGVKDLSMKIWAMPISRPYMPNGRRTAELIQADYAKVGIKSEIVSMEWGEYLKAGNDKGRDGAFMMGWIGDNGDPDNFMGVLNSCAGVGTNNYARWCNKDFDDLIQRGRTTTDHDERVKIYEEAQEFFNKEAPWLVIANSTVFMPMSNKVKNYIMDPMGSHAFDGVDIED
ncbi:ABC transporter substrate-binding protein [Bartonella sp. HY038]|uniref:ABC transporter substrate-binding protein n=1 Tax=Bartonella sp. HY038 TaxID=2759660 RepID=UPI0015FBC602|nr:ABC transporter substrate-binding protein [Bartonella sp. HY038]